MIYLDKTRYPYLEEINVAVLKHIPLCERDCQEKIAVLDVGCGQANLSLEIKKKGYCVWGIEQNEFAAMTARTRIDHVILEDIIAFDQIAEKLKSKRFEYIIFSDILEHLYDPLKVLNFYLRFLKPNGKLIISVPNAVVWLNRINFLRGKFEYEDTGVMDRTHIRFFTFKTAKQLMIAAGCTVCQIDSSPFLVRAFLPIIKKMMLRKKDKTTTEVNKTIIHSPAYQFYERFIYPIEYTLCRFWRTLFAFRIIIVGKK